VICCIGVIETNDIKAICKYTLMLKYAHNEFFITSKTKKTNDSVVKLNKYIRVY